LPTTLYDVSNVICIAFQRCFDIPAGGVGSGLGLLGLLRALGSGTLLLALAYGCETGGRAGLRSLRAALLDDIERCTDDSTLGLDLLAATSLGCLLWKMLVMSLYVRAR
jgi:hypothetical protein